MMKGHYLKYLSLLCLLGVNLAQADSSLYSQQCAACHGQNGAGNKAIKAPAIAGLSEDYLVRQLSNFKSGLRGNAPQDTSGNMMADITKSLSKAQIEKVSQYLATQPFVSAPPPTNTGGFMGRGLYRNCGSCHGAQAQGEPELHAPRLAGQHGWYLLAQLQKFKAGLRGLHAKDKFGQQMHMVSQGLDFETQVPSILAFIAHRKVLPSHDNSASRH